jgi:hypothetical protein
LPAHRRQASVPDSLSPYFEWPRARAAALVWAIAAEPAGWASLPWRAAGAAVVAFLAQSFTGHGIAGEWAAFRHISKREIGATPKMEQTNTDDPRMAKIWRGFAADMFAMQQEGCRNKVLML